MKALELIGEVDATHRLQVQVPEALPPDWCVFLC